MGSGINYVESGGVNKMGRNVNCKLINKKDLRCMHEDAIIFCKIRRMCKVYNDLMAECKNKIEYERPDFVPSGQGGKVSKGIIIHDDVFDGAEISKEDRKKAKKWYNEIKKRFDVFSYEFPNGNTVTSIRGKK